VIRSWGPGTVGISSKVFSLGERRVQQIFGESQKQVIGVVQDKAPKIGLEKMLVSG